MDKSAKQFYMGLARGRNGNWMGLLDKQLKANGHEGLWPEGRPPEQDLFEGKDKDGKPIDDPNGLLPLATQVERASKHPSSSCYLYTTKLLTDGANYEKIPNSVWDQNENLAPWVIQ